MIFVLFSDPMRNMRRTKGMLTENTISLASPRGRASPNADAPANMAVKLRVRGVKETQSDKRLAWIAQLDAVRDQKDRTAFAELFAYFAPRLKSFLMKSGTSPDMAEECAQEVMVTVWNKAHLFDPTKASVSTWIFTIARNKRIDMIRKQRRPEPEDLPWGQEEAPSHTDVIGLQQETELLGRALADLPAKQRELIERAYFGDLTHSEIASETGLPLGTIKSRIRLALDRLRHAMN